MLAIAHPFIAVSSYEGMGNSTYHPTGERTNFGTVARTVRGAILYLALTLHPEEILISGLPGARYRSLAKQK
jgi:hypothetical protein